MSEHIEQNYVLLNTPVEVLAAIRASKETSEKPLKELINLGVDHLMQIGPYHLDFNLSYPDRLAKFRRNLLQDSTIVNLSVPNLTGNQHITYTHTIPYRALNPNSSDDIGLLLESTRSPNNGVFFNGIGIHNLTSNNMYYCIQTKQGAKFIHVSSTYNSEEDKRYTKTNTCWANLITTETIKEQPWLNKAAPLLGKIVTDIQELYK